MHWSHAPHMSMPFTRRTPSGRLFTTAFPRPQHDACATAAVVLYAHLALRARELLLLLLLLVGGDHHHEALPRPTP